MTPELTALNSLFWCQGENYVWEMGLLGLKHCTMSHCAMLFVSGRWRTFWLLVSVLNRLNF